jgi:hypothetical protein
MKPSQAVSWLLAPNYLVAGRQTLTPDLGRLRPLPRLNPVPARTYRHPVHRAELRHCERLLDLCFLLIHCLHPLCSVVAIVRRGRPTYGAQ